MDDETAVTIRNDIIAAAKLRVDDLTQQYINGAITLTAWVLAMRDEITIVASQEYLLATGGEMLADDIAALEAWIFEQAQFLQDFGGELKAGALSAGQMLVRAGMYAAAGVTMYETAVSTMRGVTLPAYPGLDVQCRSNCRCSWQWVDAGNAWHVIWTLDPGAKHCPDCLSLASTYSAASPYVVAKSLSERTLA